LEVMIPPLLPPKLAQVGESSGGVVAVVAEQMKCEHDAVVEKGKVMKLVRGEQWVEEKGWLRGFPEECRQMVKQSCMDEKSKF
jgi:hypothetical protein